MFIMSSIAGFSSFRQKIGDPDDMCSAPDRSRIFPQVRHQARALISKSFTVLRSGRILPIRHSSNSHCIRLLREIEDDRHPPRPAERTFQAVLKARDWESSASRPKGLAETTFQPHDPEEAYVTGSFDSHVVLQAFYSAPCVSFLLRCSTPRNF
jgi:hypothetical protein